MSHKNQRELAPLQIPRDFCTFCYEKLYFSVCVFTMCLNFNREYYAYLQFHFLCFGKKQASNIILQSSKMKCLAICFCGKTSLTIF